MKVKNILIMGIGRAGKTTLSKRLKNRESYRSYSLIHSDSLKWAMIRADGKEEEYRINVEKQKLFERSNFFQRVLLGFFNSQVEKDWLKYGHILESGQLHPKTVSEMINFDNTVVVCLGLGSLTAEEMVDMCIKHDNASSWTYELSREYLLKHAKDWYATNEMLKKECPKYGIRYVDTSENRSMVLDSVLNDIDKEASSGGNKNV